MLQKGLGPEPLFKFVDGKPPWLVTKVREALTQVGVNCTPYSEHSFRIGDAITAAKQGMEETAISMLGQWKSSIYQLYIQTPQQQLALIS